MNFALEAASCLWVLAGRSLKLRHPNLSSTKNLLILAQDLCPRCSQTSPPPALGPGLVIQEGLSGKHSSSLGLCTFNLHKSGLYLELQRLVSQHAFTPSCVSTCLGTATWRRSEPDKVTQQSHNSIILGCLDPAHHADMQVLVPSQGKEQGREGNRPGDA